MLNVDESPSAGFAPNLRASWLRDCHKARYAELLSPEDIAELVGDEGGEPPAEGWLVFAELEQEDLARLTAERFRNLNLAVRDFDDGLPVVILTALAQHVRYVWVVPMWEVDAQVWLRDAVARGRIALVLNAVDAPQSVVLKTGEGVLQHTDALLAVTEVAWQPTGEAHLFHMLSAGFEAISADASQVGGHLSPVVTTRLMVAGRGENAAHLMNIFAAGAELAQALPRLASEVIQ